MFKIYLFYNFLGIKYTHIYVKYQSFGDLTDTLTLANTYTSSLNL